MADSLSDYDEIINSKSNPSIFDTDSDSLSDGDEVLKQKTDVLKADTDTDEHKRWERNS